jgi:amino acid adenylation domain-containing protein
MDETARRIAALSPGQRALLEARLRQVPPAEDGAPAVRSSPLSFAQARIWALAHRDPCSGFFVATRRVRLPEGASLETARAALALVVARHEALATDVVPKGDEPLQVVGAAPRDRLEAVEEGSAFAAAAAAAAGRVRALEAPLFRAVAAAGPGGVELVLVAHALVCDAPSLGIVRRELLAACRALAGGEAPELPGVALQSTEHARRQRQRLRGVRLEQLLSRYRPLEHAPALLALHADRPRVPHRLPRVARHGWTVDPGVAEGARRALGPGLGEASTWAAVAAVVLSRFAGQGAIVLGVQRRPAPDFVGAATAAVPVALDLAADPACRAVAEQVDAELRAGDAQDEVPYEKLVEELRIRHSSRHNPLFQALLAVRSELEADPGRGGPPGDDWFSGGSAAFDVALAVDDTGPAPRLDLLYDAHLFEEGAIRALARSLDAVLGEAAARPGDPVSSLALLGPDEAGDAPAARFGEPAFASTIHGIYERRAALTPDAVAVEAADEALTYRALELRANRLAHALVDRGVRRGETVGVCMERSADLVLSFLAILKAGAVYLPLDPNYPPDRLALMVADSQTRVVLARGGALADVPHACEVVDVATLDRSRWPETPVGLDVAGHEPAYLIYTSGSTGKPKGVRVQHAGVCHVADAQLRHLEVGGGDRILQFSSPSFDASIFELVMAPVSGGTLCVADADALMPGPPLLEVLRARRITVLTIPPSTLAALAPIELPELRLIVAAGETCAAEQVARWAPGRRFLNAYGPTEASIWATVAECAAGDGNPPIGLPLAHVAARVVDGRLRGLPVGAPGELVLGGPGIALGYHDRPELTAERFLPSLPGGGETRWYRTGDLVRRDAAGRLWHLGRIDRQVKLRGFRIEPAEVEALLLELPGVQAAAVEVEADVLVAYYVAGDPAPDPDELKAALERRLPQYFVPQRWTLLHAMPVGANGKLDRAALAREASRRNVGSRPARTPTERTLVEIWKTVLRLDDVGIEANFFQIGGHSLLAASVISRASVALGREVPLRTLFQSPTIADLARAFDDSRAARG